MSLRREEIVKLQRKVHETRTQLTQPGKNKNISQVFQFLYDIEELNSNVNFLRKTTRPEDPLLQSSEETLAYAAHDVLLRSSAKEDKEDELSLTEKYRLVWIKHFRLFLYTMALFIISTLVGYAMTIADSDYGSLFVGQQMLENIMDHEAWFERIQKNPIMYGLGIAWNNIRVAFTAFTLGALAGLGGIYILAFNGLMLGSVFALCQIYKFDDSLTTFISAHGPLELTLIVAATFGSFIFGRCFYNKPSEIRRRAKTALQESIYVLFGITIWLGIAAMVEVFISPWNAFSSQQKIVIGLLLVVGFWAWTFSGVKKLGIKRRS